MGVLYTLNWDGQNDANLIEVTGNGGSSWTAEAASGSVANMGVPAGQGNKTVTCGLVEASFSLQTEVIN